MLGKGFLHVANVQDVDFKSRGYLMQTDFGLRVLSF